VPGRGASPAIQQGHSSGLSHWDAHRSFGFVKRDGERDCFVHIRNINGSQEDMRVGQRVEFEVDTDGNGRPEAKNVALLED